MTEWNITIIELTFEDISEFKITLRGDDTPDTYTIYAKSKEKMAEAVLKLLNREELKETKPKETTLKKIIKGAQSYAADFKANEDKRARQKKGLFDGL